MTMESSMARYLYLGDLGDGTCGTVYKAMNLITGETVAIKKMKRKFYSWEDCILREINILRRLNHPNIIKLKEVNVENDELFFVFECMESSLYEVFRNRKQLFTEDEICNIFRQILLALEYMHRNEIFHRDLKPENILVSNEVVKIADFGLAREITSGPPYTQYVSTRWYRAPEIILQCSFYTPAVDMWAVGAMIAELFNMSPLFPGNSETDQLHKICCILGYPDLNTWPDGFRLLKRNNISFVHTMPTSFAAIIPNASAVAIDLIEKLCSWDPQRRPTAEEALHHPFFFLGYWVPRPLWDPHPSMNHNGVSYNQTREEPQLDLNLCSFGAQPEDITLRLTLGPRPTNSRPSGDQQTSSQQGREVSRQLTPEMVFCSGINNDFPSQTGGFWPIRSSTYEPGESSSAKAPMQLYYLFGGPSTFAAGR